MKVNGKIIFNDIICLNCQENISIKSDTIMCLKCGAKYELTAMIQKENLMVNADYTISSFVCLSQERLNKCTNTCPTAYMYCRDHSDDEHIKKAKYAITFAEETLSKYKIKLEKMKESKKNWIILDISGISDEQDSI